jgi:hypothetical protein
MKTGTARKEETQFKPGQSGNPGGRPKGTSITSVLRATLTEEDKLAIAQKLIAGARAGEMDKIREIMDRTEGKVPNKNENGQPGDFDLEFSDEERARIRTALKVVRGSRNP